MSSRFVWYELMTTDAAAATRFYVDVVGWAAADAGMPGVSYTLLNVGETHVAGLMALGETDAPPDARPGWLGYVAVPDVDAWADKVAAAGGQVLRPAEDIPQVGRFAVVADPQGAVLALFKGTTEDAADPPAGTVGSIGWRELMAVDLDTAWPFYATLFGWQKREAVDMGPMGTYQLFATQGVPDGESSGGMMSLPPGMSQPFWNYYFTVDRIDAAAARVTAGGGQVINGPMEVPGGDWILQGLDPQGAMFSLVGPKG